MKRYETPQVAEVGKAEEVVLGFKDQVTGDSPSDATPPNRLSSPSAVDTDE